MIQASVRTKKLHLSKLRKTKNHNQRLEMKDRLIVCPERTPSNVVVYEKETTAGLDIDAAVKKDIQDRVGGKSIRKDAVVARETVISASPEYFFPDMTDRKSKDRGPVDEDKLKQWVDVNTELLKEKYGKNLIRVDLHLDESTPHLHAIAVPIVEKTLSKRRTNAHIAEDEKNGVNTAETYTKSRLDDKTLSSPKGAWNYVGLQDDLGGDERLAALGIARGTKHSRATHTELDEYHTALINGQKKIKTIKPYEPPATPLKENILKQPKPDVPEMENIILKQSHIINKIIKEYNGIAEDYNAVVGAKNMALVKLDDKTKQIEAYTELNALPHQLAEAKDAAVRQGYKDGSLQASNELAEAKAEIEQISFDLRVQKTELDDKEAKLGQRENMVNLKSNVVNQHSDVVSKTIENIETLAKKKGLSDRELQAASATARREIQNSKDKTLELE